MKTKPEQLYLDLLKKSLSFTLWPELPIPVTSLRYGRTVFRRTVIRLIAKIFETKGLQIAQKRDFSEEQRIEGRVWSDYADTMIGLKRLDNLQFCIEKVLAEGIEGDFIETGVWRGGACILMRGVLAAYGVNDRRVFVADSFEGLPKPDSEKYPVDKGDEHYLHKFLAVSQKEVEGNFRKYGLLDEQVIFLKGWFKDTLPNAPIKKLSLLRLDGDMYGSTIESLDILYPKLQRGGFCIIDDYALAGCQQAVNDYRAKNKIDEEMKEIDWTGRYWRKS